MPEQPEIPEPTAGVEASTAPAADAPPGEAQVVFAAVKFDARGLVPCIVQEWTTGEVLMLAYMNAESLRRTLESGTTWFFSRSRNEYWNKGATSGHFQKVRELRYDCDGDTLLALVEQTGAACHTGDFTCFDGRWLSSPTGDRPPFLACREEE
jgi:phosphoribosyl-AMP cyclohydrolase